ncbi:TonB-dependent receptor [Parahaliea mediterranea]|uniref:TonB-dependent receptor n=1 Tax=Parahaliea mediterranea TaxID=651086 RepID=A0A939DC15_9GAMM|nr:TonB-dependent receptor [Parahaliea mediterranea]MBN7795463.1 TonB-dependent receptor [Parahaliea mediterranea]
MSIPANFRLHSRLALAVAGAVMASAAAGQEAAPRLVMEEITVTAQKREQSAAEIPISMTVMSSDDLREKRIQDFADLGVNTPALDVARGNSTNNPVIAIRGIGSTDPWINNNPSVSAYMDGVYLPFGSYLSMPLYDLQRVEVLKGPQAGLYGRNSIAGAINFVSTEPGDGVGGYLDLSYGRYGETNLQGAVDTPLSDTLLLRFAGYAAQGGGYMERAGTADSTAGFTRVPGVIPGISSRASSSDYGDKDVAAGRISALWRASDRLQVDLRVHYGTDGSEIVNSTNLTGDPLGVFQPEAGAVHVDYDDVAGEMDARNGGISLEVNWEGDLFTLTSLTGFESLSRDYTVGDFAPLRLAQPTYDESVDSLSQEFRISGDTGSTYWLAGVNATRDRIDYHRSLSSWDYLLGELVSGYDQDDESWSVFGQIDWQLTDSLQLSTGLRYTDEEKHYEGGSWENDPFGTSIVTAVYPAVAGGLYGESDYDDQDVSGQVKLSWTAFDNTLVYGAISRGFKSGGFDGSGIVDEAGFIPYDAEELVAYEIGVKSRLLDNTLDLSAAVYYYDYSDKQVLAILDLGGGITEAVTQNAAVSEVTGVDLDLKYLVDEHWSLGLSATLLDSEITEWNSDDPAEAAARIGNELPGTPGSNVTGDITWEGSAGDFDLRASVWATYTESTYRDIENTPSLESDSYTLVNARLSLGQPAQGWSVYLYGKNLADEEYRSSVRTLVGMEGAYFGPPRMYGVGVNWQF